MKIHQFRRIQVLPITLQEAWDYFSNPNNLSKLTPPAYDFQAAQVELPIYAGQLMVHRIRVLPFVRMNWLTEITHVVPGEMFIDQQLVGPYKIWHHRHFFKACASGVKCWMTFITRSLLARAETLRMRCLCGGSWNHCLISDATSWEDIWWWHNQLN